MKKLNAYQLKLICAFLMLLDHISPFIPVELSSVFHMISRCVAPVFAYFVVEGLFYTRNIKKYVGRLFGWGIGMALGNRLLNQCFMSKSVYVYNNIFLTLAFGLLALAVFKVAREKVGGTKALNILLGSIATLAGMVCEGGIVVIPFMLITFFFREKGSVKYICYAILSILLFKMSYVVYPNMKETLMMLMYNSDFLFVLALPLIACYNGERGPNTTFNKYFFYVFYPLHLWLIAAITFWRS